MYFKMVKILSISPSNHKPFSFMVVLSHMGAQQKRLDSLELSFRSRDFHQDTVTLKSEVYQTLPGNFKNHKNMKRKLIP